MTPPDPPEVAEEPELEHVLDSRRAGRRFLTGGGLRLLAYALGLLAGLAATPLVVHHLGAARWGEYAKVTALLFIVAALTEGGLGQMGLRELSTGTPEEHASFMRDLLGLRVALTCLGIVVALVFAVAAGWGRVVIAGVALGGAGSLLNNVQGALALPLGASMRLGWMSITDFAPQLVSAAMMAVLVLAHASLLPFYTAPLAAAIVDISITIAVVHGEIPLLPAFRPSRWAGLLRQTLVYAVATAMGAAYFRIAVVATSVLSTSVQTGYFSLSFRVLELTTTVPWLLLGSAFPILVRSAWNDPERLRYALDRLCRGALILGGWFAFALVIGAPFAIHVLEAGGRNFAPSIPVLRILGAAVAATFLLATFSYTLLSLRMFRQLIVFNVAAVVLAIGLSFVLIPSGGAQGAAILSLTLEVFLCLGYAVSLFRARPELRPSMRGLERVAVSLGLAFAAGVALHGHAVLGVITGTLVFAVALIVTRSVPDELLELVRARRR